MECKKAKSLFPVYYAEFEKKEQRNEVFKSVTNHLADCAECSQAFFDWVQNMNQDVKAANTP